MAKKSDKASGIAATVRQAILDSGLTRYQIAQQSGVEQATLSRFMAGTHGLNTTSLDRLAPVLGLRLVVDQGKRVASGTRER